MVPTRVTTNVPSTEAKTGRDMGHTHGARGNIRQKVSSSKGTTNIQLRSEESRVEKLGIGSGKLLVKRLLWSLGRLWGCGFGRRRSCRLCGGRLRSRTAGGGRLHGGLGVVRVNHSFGNIDALSCP